LRNLIIFFVVLSTTFFVLLLLQTLAQPKDVQGWNKARWGMTDEDIMKAFNEKVERLPDSKKGRPLSLSASDKKMLEKLARELKEKFEPYHTNLCIRAADIYGKKFEVHFNMNDKTNKLENVNIRPKEKPSKALFKFLEQKLIEEYGFLTRGVTISDTKPPIQMQIRNRFWIFPTTTIELNYAVIKESPSLDIYYYPTKEKDKSIARGKQGKQIEFDFRKTKWGMTKEQVKATESVKLTGATDTLLNYSSEIAGMNATIGFSFSEDKLYRASYAFNEEHTNKNNYISDYENVKEILTREYGSPKSDSSEWRNDLYENDPQYWGLAISLGHVVYLTTWETETTEILLILGGDNYKISFGVVYNSKNLKYLGVEQELEKEEGQF